MKPVKLLKLLRRALETASGEGLRRRLVGRFVVIDGVADGVRVEVLAVAISSVPSSSSIGVAGVGVAAVSAAAVGVGGTGTFELVL